MTEASKQWVGQIVDGAFPLQKYLGGTDHGAVFLTEYAEGKTEPRKAAIKLVPVDPTTADLQVSSWESAAQLSHPNVLRLFSGGRCKVDGNELAYLVMEYAEENLAQILPQRALTPEETKDMLGPVLDALEYLHGKGFVHGDLKPANILASGDRLKLSSDTISRAGESQGFARRLGAYDPPEAISGKLTPAADIWSLGITLVEVMTQRLPDWHPGPNREPAVPANIPSPFQEIARECLWLEPDRRTSIAGIGGRLNARAAAAAASAAGPVSAPVSMPKPNTSAVGGQALPATPKATAPRSRPPQATARLQSSPHRPPPYKEPGTRPRFLVPLVVGALIFGAIITVPRLLTHRLETRSTSAATPQKTVGQAVAAKSVPSAAQPKVRHSLQASSSDALKTTSEKGKPVGGAPSSLSAGTAEVMKPGKAGNISAKGDVLDQVLPDVSQKALATIHGKVRVGVKLHVDAAGAVSDAELDSPGPSTFFADQALKAARKWVFTPPEVNGKSVASEWSLRFVFTQGGAKVTPTQTVP